MVTLELDDRQAAWLTDFLEKFEGFKLQARAVPPSILRMLAGKLGASDELVDEALSEGTDASAGPSILAQLRRLREPV